MPGATTSAATGEVDLAQEAAALPTGAEAEALPQCDLVMKGGITSGVVYPGAVIALAKRFRFAAVGGTSAGAIAAGVCAAGEYGRLRGEGSGLAQLHAVSRELSKPGFLTGLFQATGAAKPAMDLALLPAAHPEDGRVRRAARLAWAAGRRTPLVWLAAAVPAIAFAVLVWRAFGDMSLALAIPLAILAAVPFALLLLGVALLLSLGLPVRHAVRSLGTSGYGACPGSRQPGYPADQEALTEWLHRQVQEAAGRSAESWTDVLTVADLRGDAADPERSIVLETMTTDLSRARPLRCPADLRGYLFKPREMRTLFPEPVVARMVQPDPSGPAPTREQLASDEPRRLDVEQLPVLLAIRLSLSFPILLSGVKLYLEHDGGYRESLFSDGGIASNFPMHFFDAWFPRRPTFGIDLGRQPHEGAPLVVMHGEDGAGGHRDVAALGAFGGQIKDTMQNWRDNLQAELPGYRDRVCDVRFKDGEGGLNLRMAPPAINALMGRGFEAGGMLADALPMAAPPDPPTDRWLDHCKVRFETLMWLQQQGLKQFGERSAAFLEALGELVPPSRAPWAAAAVEQTEALLECAKSWGPPPAVVDFEPPTALEPEPVMRVVPKA